MPRRAEEESNASRALGRIHILTRPDIRVGGGAGSGSWQVDKETVEILEKAFSIGSDWKSACMVACLSEGRYTKWYTHGARLIEEHEEGRKEFNDEEVSYMFFARRMKIAEGLWRMKATARIDEALDGLIDVSVARLGINVLARRAPVEWDLKSNVSARDMNRGLDDGRRGALPAMTLAETEELRASSRAERSRMIKLRMEGDGK